MHIPLGSYTVHPVVNLEGGNDIVAFALKGTKSVTGFAFPRVSMMFRSNLSAVSDDSDDDLVWPVYESTRNEGSKKVFQSSALIGSSMREGFFNDLEQQVAETAATDKAKQAAEEMTEKERCAKIGKRNSQGKGGSRGPRKAEKCPRAMRSTRAIR